MSDLDNEEIKYTKKLQEKSVDEMFKELGFDVTYQIFKNKITSIGYKKVGNDVYSIIFLMDIKKITINDHISLDLLDAINLKVKELNWLC